MAALMPDSDCEVSADWRVSQCRKDALCGSIDCRCSTEDYKAVIEQRKEMLCGCMPFSSSEQTRIAIDRPETSGTMQIHLSLERL
ncbi:hypothetical protein D3C73_1006810 [compost metagenome]